jgi:arginine utilization protein RocB
MQPFRFRLARVLEYQRTRLAIEEQKLERLSAERRELEAERERAAGERLATARVLSRRSDVCGLDLACLDGWACRMERRRAAIAVSIQDCARRAELQRGIVVEARRKVRLLEKLRERRQIEWTAALNREIAELASEFTVSQAARR